MIPRRDLVAVALIILAVTAALVGVAGMAWLIIPREVDTLFSWGADMSFAWGTLAAVLAGVLVLGLLARRR